MASRYLNQFTKLYTDSVLNSNNDDVETLAANTEVESKDDIESLEFVRDYINYVLERNREPVENLRVDLKRMNTVDDDGDGDDDIYVNDEGGDDDATDDESTRTSTESLRSMLKRTNTFEDGSDDEDSVKVAKRRKRTVQIQTESNDDEADIDNKPSVKKNYEFEEIIVWPDDSYYCPMFALVPKCNGESFSQK